MDRSGFLLAYKRIRFRKNSTMKVIGVIGTEQAVGTTHFSCMLGVFLSMVKGYKVAVVELCSPGSIRQAGRLFKRLNISRMKKALRIISLYTESDEVELSEIISMNYDYVIVDYGCNFAKYKKSYLMCPYKMVVGSLSWWRLQNYVTFVAKNSAEKSIKHWFFMATSPVKEGIRYLNQEFKIQIEEIPYEPDPFLLKNSLGFLHRISEKMF